MALMAEGPYLVPYLWYPSGQYIPASKLHKSKIFSFLCLSLFLDINLQI